MNYTQNIYADAVLTLLKNESCTTDDLLEIILTFEGIRQEWLGAQVRGIIIDDVKKRARFYNLTIKENQK
jgi:hypothetical protein